MLMVICRNICYTSSHRAYSSTEAGIDMVSTRHETEAMRNFCVDNLHLRSSLLSNRIDFCIVWCHGVSGKRTGSCLSPWQATFSSIVWDSIDEGSFLQGRACRELDIVLNFTALREHILPDRHLTTADKVRLFYDGFGEEKVILYLERRRQVRHMHSELDLDYYGRARFLIFSSQSSSVVFLRSHSRDDTDEGMTMMAISILSPNACLSYWSREYFHSYY